MTEEYLGGTDLSIVQAEGMFHCNSDTELLGHFMQIKHRDHVLDIGTNNGALLMYASLHEPASLCGIDLFPEAISIANENLERNRIKGELHVSSLQEFVHDRFDVLVCNPPYFDERSYSMKKSNPWLSAARHSSYLPLDELFQHADRLSTDQGRLFLVHRANRLQEILILANEHGFRVQRIRFAHKSRDKEAAGVLLELRKGRCGELKVMPPAYYDERSSFIFCSDV